jgi:hypothetical protein
MRLLGPALEKPLVLELIPPSNVLVPRRVGSELSVTWGLHPLVQRVSLERRTRIRDASGNSAAPGNGLVPRYNGFVPKSNASAAAERYWRRICP